MSDLLNKAKQHFSSLKEGVERKVIEVPEWEGKIYFTPLPLLSLEKYNRIYEQALKGDMMSFIEILILRAEDESGGKEFKPVNRLEMRKHLAPDVVTRVITEMSIADEEARKEIEENVKK